MPNAARSRTHRLGHVEPGGPALEMRLSNSVTCTKVSVGPTDNNAYLLRTYAGESVLIDAAAEPARLLKLIGPKHPHAIVTTHRHNDHLQALSEVAEVTGSVLIGGRPDLDAISTAAWVEDVKGAWDGDVIPLGNESLEVIGLVGHTPGSITIVYRSPHGIAHLFTGDSLFPGGPGKTGSPKDFRSLMNDLETKIFSQFDDNTRVHPGHGDDTTLGAERPHLEEWRERGW